MSTNFTGITFPWQKVAPSDDAIIRRAILPDGILTGCDISYSGSTLTMAAGQLMICGRQVRHPSSQNWAVVDATSGYARLLLTIDVTRTSTKDVFDQVLDTIEYASSVDGFPDLEQADINGSGTRYQVAACVVSLGAGGITGIESQLKKSAVDGAGLNFKVVGGVTQPSDPAENTIWVNTGTAITSWIFSTTEPAEPVEGMVWIKTGTSSSVEFNAAKKNTIQVYPMYAKQYVSGAWIAVAAKSYLAGAWVDWWNGGLYDAGNEFEMMTGGWTGTGLTKNADNLYLKGNGVYCQTANGVSTLGYTSAVFEAMSQSTSSNGKSYVGFLDDSGAEVAKVQVTPGIEKTVVQVPLDAVQGTFKPYLWTQAYNQGAYLYSVYLTI